MFLFDFYTIETFSSKISSINLSLFQKNLSKFRSNFSKISSFSSRFFLPKKLSSQAAWQDGVFLDVGLEECKNYEISEINAFSENENAATLYINKLYINLGKCCYMKFRPISNITETNLEDLLIKIGELPLNKYQKQNSYV